MRNRTMRPGQAEAAQDGQRGRRSDGTDSPGTEENHERKRRDRGHHGGDHGHHDGHQGGRGGGRRGAGRGRARRGEARYVLLDALRDGPKHGYEIIKSLEERSAGQYVPSPGTVYPTLQYLEDQGLVRAEQEADRRVYQLTAAGKAELDEQAEPLAAFWARFVPQTMTPAGKSEIAFLEDELAHLNRIVWSGLRDAIAQSDQATIRRVRQVVETCQTQVREVIAGEL